MLPRCGRAAHICEANYFATSSPCCNRTFLKLSNSLIDCLCETSWKFGQGNGAIAARWQAKARVEPPFAGCGRLVSLEASFPSNKPQATEKFFGAAVFQKCCRGVGEQPTFAKQIQFCNLFFLLQLHSLKLANSQLIIFMKQVANSDKATGQLLHAGRQKQGWNPLLPDVEDRFP